MTKETEKLLEAIENYLEIRKSSVRPWGVDGAEVKAVKQEVENALNAYFDERIKQHFGDDGK